ncbi:hypothetical protein [Nocardioides sp. W7]|uniref:hypothetical protein n=1 Tax=Nocardioides sp. W7 TaxID=2931390 RepID=UPI001FD4ED80|nr:hypothetical protein [Nocardioides sp. W7]
MSESRRVRLNLLLYVLALVAGVAVVVVGVSVVDRVRDDPAPSSLPADGAVQAVALEESDDEEQQRLAAVVESASAEVEALLNVRYDEEKSVAAVLSGATGEFREQYEKATEGLLELMKKQESIQESEVVWTGVVAADADSATVAVAASGTVANKATKGEPTARNYRVQLELVLEDGAWLTRDLQFVP